MTDTEQTLPLATPDEPGLPESVAAAKRALIGRPLATGATRGQAARRSSWRFRSSPRIRSRPSPTPRRRRSPSSLRHRRSSARHFVLPDLDRYRRPPSRSWCSRTGRASPSYAVERRLLRVRAREPRHCARARRRASLLTDYVLTVAVSVAAGVFAITSVFPTLAGAQGRTLARLHPRPHARKPARCSRVRLSFRLPDVRIHRARSTQSSRSAS